MADKILTQTQIKLLERVAKEPSIIANFYFTGGTPLAAFYLQHRYSEDLDFFSEQEVDTVALTTTLQALKTEGLITNIDYEQSYNRNIYQLYTDSEIVKTEFTYYPFARIEQGEKKFGFNVDSPLDIAVNKLFTIYQRSKARDYIDLYLLCEKYHYKLDELIAKAKIKFDWHIDPLQLGTQFTRALTAEDMPRMITQLEPKTWQDFFLNSAESLKTSVLE